MKAIAEHFINKGEAVDKFWCSSDPDSLDGILLRGRHIAFMDGTRPHIIDPQNPGAVDTILHLGDFWDTVNLKANKDNIIKSNSIIKTWFECAYINLQAASVLRSLISGIYKDAVCRGELYKTVDKILENELTGESVTIAEGQCGKYFASAITHKGNLSHMKSLISDYKKLYLLSAPVGFATENIMNLISESAVHRGLCIEQYYCPMDPAEGIEHVLIPEKGIGFLTLNDYHDMDCRECDGEVCNIELREFIDWNSIEKYFDVIENCESESNRLIDQAIVYLQREKQEHDVLEGYYVPNMNFEKIKNLTAEWIAKIEHNEL